MVASPLAALTNDDKWSAASAWTEQRASSGGVIAFWDVLLPEHPSWCWEAERIPAAARSRGWDAEGLSLLEMHRQAMLWSPRQGRLWERVPKPAAGTSEYRWRPVCALLLLHLPGQQWDELPQSLSVRRDQESLKSSLRSPWRTNRVGSRFCTTQPVVSA